MAENDESLDMCQSYKYAVSGSETKNKASFTYNEIERGTLCQVSHVIRMGIVSVFPVIVVVIVIVLSAMFYL